MPNIAFQKKTILYFFALAGPATPTAETPKGLKNLRPAPAAENDMELPL
jgi:hypothetical protein